VDATATPSSLASLKYYYNHFYSALDFVDWAAGRASGLKTEWWDAGMVILSGRCADLHMAQLMPLPLIISCSSKSRLVLPFWY